MRRIAIAALLAGAGAVGCASPQRLSASIYAHEQAAYELDAAGQYARASQERRQAERERERLSSTTTFFRFARDNP